MDCKHVNGAAGEYLFIVKRSVVSHRGGKHDVLVFCDAFLSFVVFGTHYVSNFMSGCEDGFKSASIHYHSNGKI